MLDGGVDWLFGKAFRASITPGDGALERTDPSVFEEGPECWAGG